MASGIPKVAQHGRLVRLPVAAGLRAGRSEMRELELGTVIARGSNPIHFLAVVVDLDQTPTCREEWVRKALEQIIREVNARDIRSLALPLLGGVHGSLSAAQFAAALCSALKQAMREPSLRIWLLLEKAEAREVIEYLEKALPGCRHVD